jgi:hypothetical protein
MGACEWTNVPFYVGDYVEVVPYSDAGWRWNQRLGRRGVVLRTITWRPASSIPLVEVQLDGDEDILTFEDDGLRILTLLDLLAEI